MGELRGRDPGAAVIVSYVSLPEAADAHRVLYLLSIHLPRPRPGGGPLGLMAIGDPYAPVSLRVKAREFIVLLIVGRHGVRGLLRRFHKAPGVRTTPCTWRRLLSGMPGCLPRIAAPLSLPQFMPIWSYAIQTRSCLSTVIAALASESGVAAMVSTGPNWPSRKVRRSKSKLSLR